MARPFKEIDLAKAVPPNTVAITFRYQITRRAEETPPLAELADNAKGEGPVVLATDSGKVTVRLRTPQKLYYRLANPQLHLKLWIVGYQALNQYSC